MSTPAEIQKFFLVDDPSDTGMSMDLVNMGLVSQDLVSIEPPVLPKEVCFLRV